MGYTKFFDKYISSNNNDFIKYFIFYPEEPPKAVLQISHGMCEYIERYEPFADFLTSKGIIVCGNNHLGHKGSAERDEELGYFAPKDGWTYLAKDLHKLTELMKDKHPRLPYFLLGHSMGSFVARDYISKFGDELDGVLISGTSGNNPLSGFGILLANILIKTKGGKYRSNLLNKASFAGYNKYTEKRTKSDWLTRDQSIIDKYIDDKYCNFIFTAKGFNDLFHLLNYVSSDEWPLLIPKELPVYIFSGDKDPVGSYGKGVKEVYDKLASAGLKDVSLKLYEGGRHEMLNETNRQEVYEDILKWLSERIE